jgi:ABC-2 type transport system ATP-binding protein
MDTTMIEVRDLVKSYGQNRALKGITFSVPRGQIVGFLGPNGAGKTTTMKILTGYLRSTAGGALIQGRPVDEDSFFTRSRIGYLPENAPLYEEMMVLEFLGFIADLRQIPAADRRQRIQSMVDACGLGDVLGKDIGQLSKGFRQRVGLAQAMIHDPEILILDEPTSGLDPNQIADIRDLIRELGREKTLILSTHILPEVQATCDRVIIINDGTLVADDTIAGLTSGDGARVRLTVASRDGGEVDVDAVAERLRALDGVRAVHEAGSDEVGTASLTVFPEAETDARREVFDAVVAGDLVLLEMLREGVSLEETFRRLTAATGGHHA